MSSQTRSNRMVIQQSMLIHPCDFRIFPLKKTSILGTPFMDHLSFRKKTATTWMMTPWRPHWQQSGDDKVVKGAWTGFCWAENTGKDGKIRFESTFLVGLNMIFQVEPVAWGVWRQFRCEEGATAWNLEHDTPETWDWKGMVLQSTGNGTCSKLMKRVAT